MCSSFLSCIKTCVAESNVIPLQVGIIGLAANWQNRFREALCAERERYTLRWLYDETYQRSVIEAKSLAVPAVDGLTGAISDPDLDAVVLLDDQWFHLWPVEVACRFDKPIFCVPYYADETEHPDANAGDVPALRGTHVYFYRPVRECAVTKRLHKLLASQLGSADIVVWQSSVNSCSLSDAVDWVLHLFPGLPISVQKVQVGPAEKPALETTCLDFGQGHVAQISLIAARVSKGAEIQIITAHGSAHLRLPNRLSWSLQGSVFHERLRQEITAERRALRKFHALVTSDSHWEVGLEEERRLRDVMKMVDIEQ